MKKANRPIKHQCPLQAFQMAKERTLSSQTSSLSSTSTAVNLNETSLPANYKRKCASSKTLPQESSEAQSLKQASLTTISNLTKWLFSLTQSPILSSVTKDRMLTRTPRCSHLSILNLALTPTGSLVDQLCKICTTFSFNSLSSLSLTT
jgi:hypothetical protein